MTAAGEIDPAKVITEDEPLMSAIDAYKTFEERHAGWIKVKLEPAASETKAKCPGVYARKKASNKMKAVVFHGVGDIRLDDVPEPTLQEPTDAIIRVTSCAICGTDLHLVRGTESKVEPGTILGHEGVGIVEQVGQEITTVKPGDRVVVTSSISCGTCENCRQGRYDLCLRANPNGPRVITAMFGATKEAGSFPGLQAEKARIPFADSVLIKLPDNITDEQAILLSDIFPAGYYGADLAQIKP
jgi:threonine dehydrogenase-like Zn-dependent dehydrogenase